MRIERYPTGVVAYFNDDNDIHREDGPAIIERNGTEKWCQHGRLHRENEPAVVYPNGGKEWWYEGQLHRVDGPAVIEYLQWGDFRIKWYHHGKQSRSYIHWLYDSDKTKEEIVFLKLKYGADPYERDFLC